MKNLPFDETQRYEKIRSFIRSMPSLSVTVAKVLEICDQPYTSPDKLNKVISLDPILTGQVLKLVNSAFYSLPDKVSSLTKAIILLGINTVKNLALCTATIAAIGKNKPEHELLDMDHFFTHSLCVGVAAKALAEQRGVSKLELEEYFVTGLLHDLGKIPLIHCCAEEYVMVHETITEKQCPLQLAEIQILGHDHTMIGKMIAEKWQLPHTVVDSIAHHHYPNQATEANRELVAIVALANIYANKLKIGDAGESFEEPPFEAFLLRMLNMTWDDVASLSAEIEKELENARIFLQLPEQ